MTITDSIAIIDSMKAMKWGCWFAVWKTPNGQAITGPYYFKWGGIWDRPFKSKLILHISVKPKDQTNAY